MKHEKLVYIISIVTIILFTIVNLFLNKPSVILYIANLLPLALFTYYIKLKGFSFLKANTPYIIPNLILWIVAAELAMKLFYYYGEQLNYNINVTKIIINLVFLTLYFTLLKVLIKKPVQVH